MRNTVAVAFVTIMLANLTACGADPTDADHLLDEGVHVPDGLTLDEREFKRGERVQVEILEAHEIGAKDGQKVGKCSSPTSPMSGSFIYSGGRLQSAGNSSSGLQAQCYYKVAWPNDGDQCLIHWNISYTPAWYKTVAFSQASLASNYYESDGGIMLFYGGSGVPSGVYLRMSYEWCMPLGAEDGFRFP